SEERASNLFTIFLASTPDLERFFQVSKRLVPPFGVHSRPSAQNRSTLQLIYQHGDFICLGVHEHFLGFWCNFSREGRLSLFSASPYAASTASHTCRTMASGPMISDVSNCPFLILFASSIPLNVTSAFPNVLNLSIG